MTQTTLTPQVLPAPTDAAPHLTLTFTAADAANGNRFKLNGDQILIARNTGAGARTVTITSAPDPYGRLGDVSALSIPAGGIVVFSKFNTAGWRQSSGYLHFSGEHAEVVFAILDLGLNRNFG
jgi:hypothetical protein